MYIYMCVCVCVCVHVSKDRYIHSKTSSKRTFSSFDAFHIHLFSLYTGMNVETIPYVEEQIERIDFSLSSLIIF